MINEHYEYRTRIGSYAVRFYDTDCGGWYPIHGAVMLEGLWTPMRWSTSGKSEEGKEFDLVMVKYAPKREKAVIVVNQYPCPMPQRILEKFNGKRVRITLEELK